MLATFQSEKLIQAAAVLLRAEGGHMTRLRLVKLLYIADRESIQETGRPITGGEVLAMEHGPVPERAYRSITGSGFGAQEWGRYFRNVGRDVELIPGVDPDVDRLSRYELRKLQAVSEHFQDMDEWKIVRHTHDFPEWLRNAPDPGGVRRIRARDILEAVGLGAEADQILAEAQGIQQFEQDMARAALG